MGKLLSYDITARWGPRFETPRALAERTLNLIRRFQIIAPILARWYVASETGFEPLDFASASLANWIDEKRFFEEDTGPMPRAGYMFHLYNDDSDSWGPRGLGLDVIAGARTKQNLVSLGTHFGFVPDPDIITYAIFKAAALALAECFDAPYCDAYPGDLIDLWPDRGRHMDALRLAWINYVSPRFAPLIKPPASAIVEYQPNGGLFMAATDETFVTSNSRHLAVAFDILAAVAPLNADPWPDVEFPPLIPPPREP
jgi:Immunity protein 52